MLPGPAEHRHATGTSHRTYKRLLDRHEKHKHSVSAAGHCCMHVLYLQTTASPA